MSRNQDASQQPGWLEHAGQAGRYLAQSLRLMVGLPDYEAYLTHMRGAHPDQPPMSFEAFFRERQQARYGGARAGRCC
jgi:uncharacterized short protein YbdD (DUF466 family)